MTNSEKIKNMSNQELAEYVQAVYIAGQYKAIYGIQKFPDTEVDYIEWLKIQEE